MNTAKLFRSSIAVAGVVSLLLPGMAMAQDDSVRDQQERARPALNAGVNFCTIVDTWSTDVAGKIARARNSLKDRQGKLGSRVDERKEQRDEKLGDVREKHNDNRDSRYDRLTTKAITDAQKQAVADFRSSMESAVTARRAAVDAARTAYWNGVNQLVDSRQGSVTQVVDAYAASLESALATAKSECANGVAPATAREHFGTALRTANATFVEGRKAIERFGPQVRTLAETRNQAIKKAMTDFKTAAEAARAKLKAAFAAS